MLNKLTLPSHDQLQELATSSQRKIATNDSFWIVLHSFVIETPLLSAAYSINDILGFEQKHKEWLRGGKDDYSMEWMRPIPTSVSAYINGGGDIDLNAVIGKPQQQQQQQQQPNTFALP